MKTAKKISLKKLVERIKETKSFLVTTHTNPDGDGIGSMIALGMALKKMGKKVTFYTQDHIPKMYHYLPGVSKVVHKLNPNTQYGISFIIDLGEVERVGEAFANHKGRGVTMSLDHHIKGAHNADYNYCLPHLASSGEVIYKVIAALKVPLNKAMSTNLYTAIVTDTGSFKYSNTSHETLAVASNLVKTGVDVWQVALHCFETASLKKMELLKRVLNTMQVHKNKKIAWIVIKQRDYKVTKACPDDAEGFINYPRSVDTVEVAVAFKEQEDGSYRISMRSKNYADVGAVAMFFGGGGHTRASGCRLSGSLEQVRKSLFKKILPLLK